MGEHRIGMVRSMGEGMLVLNSGPVVAPAEKGP